MSVSGEYGGGAACGCVFFSWKPVFNKDVGYHQYRLSAIRPMSMSVWAPDFNISKIYIYKYIGMSRYQNLGPIPIPNIDIGLTNDIADI